jgi:hypothetical protein
VPAPTGYHDAVAAAVAGHRWVVVGHPDGAVDGIVDALLSAGAGPLLAITSQERPQWSDRCETISLDLPEDPTLTGTRGYHHAIRDQAARLQDVVDRFDPRGMARALGSMFYPERMLAGRPYLGPARAEITRYDNELEAGDLLSRCSLPMPDGEAVPVSDPRAALLSHRHHDRGAGTRWSSHPRDGFTFDGEFVRVVRNDQDAVNALAWYSQRCDLVRIMPNSRGYRIAADCLVTESQVHVMELTHKHTLTERASGAETIFAAGSFRPPDDALVATVAHAANAVGSALRANQGFLGAFALEGMVDVDSPDRVAWSGLSPWLNGGLIRLGAEIGVSFALLVPLVAGGLLPGFDAAPVWRAAAGHRLRRPRMSAWLSTDAPPLSVGLWWLAREAGAWRLAGPGEPPDAAARVSPLAPSSSSANRTRIEVSPAIADGPFSMRATVLDCVSYLDGLLNLNAGRRYRWQDPA